MKPMLAINVMNRTALPALQRTAAGCIRLRVQFHALEETARALWSVPDVSQVTVRPNTHEVSVVTRSVPFEHWVEIVELVLERAGNCLEKVKGLSWNCALNDHQSGQPSPA